MKRTILMIVIGGLLLGALSGCARYPRFCSDPRLCSYTRQGTDLVSASYGATDALLNSPTCRLDPSKPILVATYPNVDNLDSASTFGRIVAEQMASRLTQHKYNVVEVRLRERMRVEQRQGEFALSRELERLGRGHRAQAFLTGTYAVGGNSVYVNARLVRALDNRVVASTDFSVPIDKDVKGLLTSQRLSHRY